MSKSIDDLKEYINELKKDYYKNSENGKKVNEIIEDLEIIINNSNIPSTENDNLKKIANNLLDEIIKHQKSQKRMQTKSYQALNHINKNRLEYSVLGLGSGIGLVVVSSTMCFMLIVLICLCISSYFYLTKKSSKKK